ncbi:MAG: L-threonylcarbamoyladenylate synthase [Dehalococcoidia bacterium]|jgi:L-threonylcarbamoyladenylate synthase
MRIFNWGDSPDAALTAAVDSLRQGKLVAFPTDTLYGLGVDATNDEAVRWLYKAKRRPLDAPLPILVDGVDQASALTQEMPELALRLASCCWPGPLTLVLKRGAAFHSLALGGGDTVALRAPDHAVPLALIGLLERPLTGTSANRSGDPPPHTADEVARQLADEVDIIIDAGAAPLGVESTVLDLTVDPPRILRQGALSRRDLEAAAGVSFEPGGN